MDIAPACIVCLTDIDLMPIGEFENLYEVLAGTGKLTDQKLLTCLTCYGFFAEIKKFQVKIQSARVFLATEDDFEYSNGSPEPECEPLKEESEIKDEILKFENDVSYSFESPEVPEPIINTIANVSKSEKTITQKCNKNNDLHESLNIPEPFIETIPNESNILVSEKPLNFGRKKTFWSDKDIDKLMKRHRLPFDQKYVKELLAYRNMKPKILNAEEFFTNKYDLAVETQVCIDDTEVKDLMKKSISQQQYRKQKIKCNKCVLVFKGKKLLNKHIVENHAKSLGLYECKFCGTRSSNEQSIKAHSWSHYSKYVCRLCGHVDCNEPQMMEHFRHKKKIFQCTLCKQIFGKRSDFNEHHNSMHMKFTCDYCNKYYTDRFMFEMHIIKVHSTHPCKDCGKVFVNYKRLDQHIRFMHSVEPLERNYCVECDRHFANRMRYQTHWYRHRHRKQPQQARFPCSECDASYRDSYYLRRHIDYVHKNLSVQCDKCSKRFIDKFHLQRHIKDVHEKVRRPKDKICQYCSRGFSTARTLTHHVRTHTGERPHACTLCAAAFAQKTALHTHLKAKHKDAPPELMVWKTTKKNTHADGTDLQK